MQLWRKVKDLLLKRWHHAVEIAILKDDTVEKGFQFKI